MKHTMNTFSSPTHDRGGAQDSSNGNDDSNIYNNKENTNEHNDSKDDQNYPHEFYDETTSVTNPTEKDTLETFQDSRRSLELEKIRRHKLQAAQDIERYKKEKMQRVKEKEEEKKRDLQMLTEFYPWGTTIGKFERGDYRRQKWDIMGNTPKNQNNSENRTQSGQPSSNVEPTTYNQSNQINNELSEMEIDKFITDERNEIADTDYQENGGKNNDNETGNWNSEKENPTEAKRMYYDCGGQDKSPDSPRQVSSYSMRISRSQSPSETMRARAARVYMEELKKGMEEQRKKKEEMKREYNAPVGELAAVIGMGKVGKPRRDPYTGILLDNHLRTSDISKSKMGYHYPEDPQFKTKYCNDLITAAEERYRLRELEKLKLKQQEKQHQDTFNGVWGRPGGGAPRDPNLGNRISNINQIFYKNEVDANKAGVQEDNTGYQNTTERTFRFSTHQNCYDYPTNRRSFKEYNIRTPWANFY
ncbi:uncharacterized protein LOC115209500 isoform X2 [Octopus sinensis]|uniref:Uncharacterized protein LOC115209500 isoform X2 n=1 Tax=Octopus sinensis TaxID=2607531 RepID=A0A7E6EQG9_9MOLL|nr:uncharacterized protein LOC115209500 isoform X2 [Octopus sinensis]